MINYKCSIYVYEEILKLLLLFDYIIRVIGFFFIIIINFFYIIFYMLVLIFFKLFNDFIIWNLDDDLGYFGCVGVCGL